MRIIRTKSTHKQKLDVKLKLIPKIAKIFAAKVSASSDHATSWHSVENRTVYANNSGILNVQTLYDVDMTNWNNASDPARYMNSFIGCTCNSFVVHMIMKKKKLMRPETMPSTTNQVSSV